MQSLRPSALLAALPPLLGVALFVFATAAPAAENQPNIVFILADDMGYGDIQALEPDSDIPTPNLNRLASEGMTFTDAHSPSAVCTPTRYATITGRYCWRSRLKSGVLDGYGRPLIERSRPTVASHLSALGYRTGVVGKWHLGLGFRKEGKEWNWEAPLTHAPTDLGFGRSLVIPASLDFPPYVYVEGDRITGPPDRTQPRRAFPPFMRKGPLGSDFSPVDCLDTLTGHAREFIEEQAGTDAPFFLYFPLSAPHKPVLPHRRFEGKTELGPYGDFINQVDWSVGEILDALDEAGAAEDTLVFYTSDNGSYMRRQSDESKPDHVDDETVQAYYEGNHTANGPWRGTKADIWEAGHRVPFFARWPGEVEAGSTCGETICHVDLFATASALAGGDLPPPERAAPDSFDLTPLLRGKPEDFERAPVVHHSARGFFAIREGDWKLVLGSGSGGRERPRGQRFGTPFQLYNLAEDPGETNDRFRSERELAADLESKLFRMLADGASR